MSLRLDWCSHEAAKYAVMHWHYSRTMPLGKLIRVGVWEGEEFVGCIVFARGNSPTLGKSYGLTMTQICELVRIALRQHHANVSRLVSISLKLLKKFNPGIRLVVSFADPAYGHHGGIYQAGNWLYDGDSKPEFQFLHAGRWKHRREVTSGAFGGARKIFDRGQSLPKRLTPGKHRYLMPLDAEMRAKIAPLARPYPKRVRSAENGTETPISGGGVIPTRTLQL